MFSATNRPFVPKFLLSYEESGVLFFQMQATSVADQLRFASHSVRSRLDEIKRREISRLNELEKKYANLKEKKTTHHVDHFNPHTFEIEDLQKLIKKVTSDLVEIDQKQENEYKE